MPTIYLISGTFEISALDNICIAWNLQLQNTENKNKSYLRKKKIDEELEERSEWEINKKIMKWIALMNIEKVVCPYLLAMDIQLCPTDSFIKMDQILYS